VETTSMSSTTFAFAPSRMIDALAEGSFDLRQCRVQRLALIHCFVLYKPQRILCHLIHL
jgi:hypothetical protein